MALKLSADAADGELQLPGRLASRGGGRRAMIVSSVSDESFRPSVRHDQNSAILRRMSFAFWARSFSERCPLLCTFEIGLFIRSTNDVTTLDGKNQVKPNSKLFTANI